MDRDLSQAYLARIAKATEDTAAISIRSRQELMKVRSVLKSLVTWIKRASLLVALYGSGITLLMLSQEKARLLAEIIRAVR